LATLGAILLKRQVARADDRHIDNRLKAVAAARSFATASTPSTKRAAMDVPQARNVAPLAGEKRIGTGDECASFLFEKRCK
jgi:hypothetical protein